MISSFKQNEKTTPAAAKEIAVVEQAVRIPQAQTAPPPSGSVEGEFLPGDFIIPKLHLAQSVWPLSETFQPGAFVYNKEIALSDGVKPLSVTVLRIRKQYVENVPYGSDEIARVFDTLDEVKQAGGWIDWKDNQKPPFGPMLHALVLIKSPTGPDLMFPYEFEGGYYGVGLWTLRSTAFTRVGKTLITASQFSLKNGLHQCGWTLTSKREKIGMNFVFVPVLRQEAPHSQAFVGFAAGLLT